MTYDLGFDSGLKQAVSEILSLQIEASTSEREVLQRAILAIEARMSPEFLERITVPSPAI